MKHSTQARNEVDRTATAIERATVSYPSILVLSGASARCLANPRKLARQATGSCRNIALLRDGVASLSCRDRVAVILLCMEGVRNDRSRRQPFRARALIIDDDLAKLETSIGRAAENLARALEERGVDVARAYSLEDGLAVVVADASIQAVLLDWDLGADDEGSHLQATELLEKLRERHGEVPVFLSAERTTATRTITIEVAEMVDEFVWMLEDTPGLPGRPYPGGDRAVSRIHCFRLTRKRLPTTRVFASIRGRRPATRAAWHSPRFPPVAPSLISTARISSAPTWASNGANSGLCSITPDPCCKASDTRLGSLAHTAATPVSSEPPAPIGPSCRPARTRAIWWSSTGTATSRSSRASS